MLSPRTSVSELWKERLPVTEAIRKECRKRGSRYIRLDTGLDEKEVRRIYLNAGYKIVDIIDYPNGRSMALYELEVNGVKVF